MIEQPRTIVLTESKVSDASHPDAPLEKREFAVDEEVSVFKEQPITSSIRKTIRLLHTIGGFTSRWRGLSISIVYHMCHGILTNSLTELLSSYFNFFVPFAFSLATIFASLWLSVLHMTWTHIMISQPSKLPWFRRCEQGVAKRAFVTLAFPTLLFTIAQQLLIALPFGVFLSWGGVPVTAAEANATNEIMRLISTLATAAFVALVVLLPASVTLTRMEASLLPENEETIVHFDRTLGGAATSAISLDGKIDARARFNAAWASVDRAQIVRLIKFYVKFAMIQTFIVVTGLALLAIQVYVLDPARLNSRLQDAYAQLQAGGN